jgi:hypothetical protein
MGVGVRIIVGAVVAASAALGLLPAWFLAGDLLVQDRTIVSGRILEKGTERVSAGRGTSDRLLLTIEGQPYVFFRTVGWLTSQEAMLDTVEVGHEAAVEVHEADLAGYSSFAPNDRRIEIVSLTQDGIVIFTRWGLLLPRIIGAFVLALISLLALAVAFLLVYRPALLSREARA